jgi:hypothetical protein
MQEGGGVAQGDKPHTFKTPEPSRHPTGRSPFFREQGLAFLVERHKTFTASQREAAPFTAYPSGGNQIA